MGDVGAQFKQNLGNIDLHRTDFRAGAAQAGSERQPGVLGDAMELGRNDGADRSRIDPRIVVAADLPVHRAVIETGAAADAVQRLALAFIGQQPRTAVVHQDKIELLGTVDFSGTARTAQKRGVDGKRLPGGAAAQHLQEGGQILGAGNDLLKPRDGDLNAGRGTGQPRIAFVFHQHDGPGVGDEKVRSRDAQIGRDELFAQHAARHLRLLLRLLDTLHLERFGEDVGHVVARLVQSRGDDVVRLFVSQLQNVFAEIGLHDLDPAMFKMLVEVDLLGGHRLRLDDALHALLAR